VELLHPEAVGRGVEQVVYTLRVPALPGPKTDSAKPTHTAYPITVAVGSIVSIGEKRGHADNRVVRLGLLAPRPGPTHHAAPAALMATLRAAEIRSPSP
jgi:hypothetical protein